MNQALIKVETIAQSILMLRGQRVILDTDDENLLLISQIAISKAGRGGRRIRPYAF